MLRVTVWSLMSVREKSGAGFALANRGPQQKRTANIETLNCVRRLKTMFFSITSHPELLYISIIAEVIRSVRKKEKIKEIFWGREEITDFSD